MQQSQYLDAFVWAAGFYPSQSEGLMVHGVKGFGEVHEDHVVDLVVGKQ